MAMLTGSEMAKRLRRIFPNIRYGDFDDDLATFTDGGDEGTYCAILMAFGWTFDRWIANNEAEAIKRALAVIDEFLAAASEEEDYVLPGEGIENAVLTCFLENILPTTPEGWPLVVPNLGPLARALCEEYIPTGLRPDPRTHLHS